MHIDAAFPSKYLKVADLGGRTVRVIIDRIEIEEVGDGDRKPIVYFQGKDRGLALNRVNADTISAAYGPETDAWTGQMVELYPDPNVYYGGKKVGGLRVRIPRLATAPVIQPPRYPNGGGFQAPFQPPQQAPQQYSEREPPPPLDDDIPF